MAKPPYTPARLVNGTKPVSSRWYVVFHVWDAQKEMLVRKRDYSVNKLKTKGERLTYAKQVINELNAALADGKHVNIREKKKQEAQTAVISDKDFTVEAAFAYILPIIKQSKRPETYNSYNSVSGLFTRFSELVGWDQWKIRTLDRSDIIAWLDHLQVTDKIANTTRNNYKSFISGIFTMMVERGILKLNPALGIKELAEDDGGNIAYTPEQIEVLKKAIQANEPRLWLFISFMLYGFIRPAEIGRIQVKMINLDENVIFLPGSITKNRKPRHVKISAAWKKYFLDLNLPRHSGNEYVFGYNLETGVRKIQKNYPNKVHHDIARPLGFGPEYTLYSWKHTGVVIHYKAGIDVKTLQAQIGHQSLHETDIYLKSLNLYKNSEFEDKSPVI